VTSRRAIGKSSPDLIRRYRLSEKIMLDQKVWAINRFNLKRLCAKKNPIREFDPGIRPRNSTQEPNHGTELFSIDRL
jgi:hypothetical protein